MPHRNFRTSFGVSLRMLLGVFLRILLGVTLVAAIAAGRSAASPPTGTGEEAGWPCSGSRPCEEGLDDLWAGDYESGARQLRAACNDGNAHACRYSGCLLEQGLGVEADRHRALKDYRRACDGGDGAACRDLGGRADASVRTYWFRRACELGEPVGCRKVARSLEIVASARPRAVAQVEAEFEVQVEVQIEALMRRSCSLGHVDSCVALARRLQRRGDAARRADEIVGLLHDACVDHEEGCHDLAELFLAGHLVSPDLARVARYRARTCAGSFGSGLACSRLDSFATGFDPRLAIRRLGDTCETGDRVSCRYLAFLYLRGEGVAPDPVRAVGLFERGCRGDDDFSCSMAGALYERGVLGEARRAEAIQLYWQGGRNDFPPRGGRPCEPNLEVCPGSRVPNDISISSFFCHGGPRTPSIVSTIFGSGLALDDSEAIEQIDRHCSQGDPLACRLLARAHSEGFVAWPPDPATVERLHRRSCELGSVNGCYELLFSVSRTSEGEAPRDAEVAEIARPLCEQGFGFACRRLAEVIPASERTGGDAEASAEALSLFRRGCELDDDRSCVLYLARVPGSGARGSGEGDHRYVLHMLAERCERSTWFCARLGRLYEEGTGVARDLGEAARLYRRSCNGDRDGWSCHRLGRLHALGLGVEQDQRMAVQLLRHACVGDVWAACGALLEMSTQDPSGVPDEPDSDDLVSYSMMTAVRRLETECREGEPYWCWRLGDIFSRAGPTARPIRPAAPYFETACRRGMARSCLDLALLYSRGKGVEQNLERAGKMLWRSTVLSMPDWLQPLAPQPDLPVVSDTASESD